MTPSGRFLPIATGRNDPLLYDLAKSIHTYVAWLCGALVGGHALVALTHHFVEKDEVLKSMLPGRNS